MDHLGHGLALQHQIFQRPVPVEFEWIERDRPAHYAAGETSPLYPAGVPETYRLAKFETEKPDGWNPTIVSHEGFFTDVPGFENLEKLKAQAAAKAESADAEPEAEESAPEPEPVAEVSAEDESQSAADPEESSSSA